MRISVRHSSDSAQARTELPPIKPSLFWQALETNISFKRMKEYVKREVEHLKKEKREEDDSGPCGRGPPFFHFLLLLRTDLLYVYHRRVQRLLHITKSVGRLLLCNRLLLSDGMQTAPV